MSQKMSASFRSYVRHTVECHSTDGQLQRELEKIEQELLSEIPTESAVLGESDAVFQARLNLAYLRGYRSGPAPELLDKISVEEGIEQRPEPKIKGKRRK